MRLTNEKIEGIKDCSSKGMNQKQMAAKFNVAPATIRYWRDEKFRKATIKRIQNNFTNLPKEEKSKVYRNRLEYMKIYWKKRYKSDPEFRQRQLNRVARYNKRKKEEK